MRINYNASAMISNNALANNDNMLAKSLQRLSSGLKINQAKDGPSGLAMAKRMNAQIEGISTAGDNAGDGISIIETADGALSEVSEMLQRMNELAVKSATDTMTDDDRKIIQSEIAQLKEEVQRVSDTTEFNGQKLLNGEFSKKGYTNQPDIKVNGYSDKVPIQEYSIKKLPIKMDKKTGEVSLTGAPSLGKEFPKDTQVSIKDNMVSFTTTDGFELKLDVNGLSEYNGGAFKIDVTGQGPMRLQIGANEGQVLEVDIPATNLRNLGIEKMDVSTKEGADDAIERISGAIKTLSSIRGRLGAYQNRLESTINSLDITEENMTAAYSRIMDVDMAEEMTHYSTAQVLTQAGTSMLAQANERPSQVLQLLQ